jgi:hypothetical protein
VGSWRQRERTGWNEASARGRRHNLSRGGLHLAKLVRPRNVKGRPRLKERPTKRRSQPIQIFAIEPSTTLLAVAFVSCGCILPLGHGAYRRRNLQQPGSLGSIGA